MIDNKVTGSFDGAQSMTKVLERKMLTAHMDFRD